jgi:hypothetical protein
MIVVVHSEIPDVNIIYGFSVRNLIRHANGFTAQLLIEFPSSEGCSWVRNTITWYVCRTIYDGSNIYNP